MGQTPGSGRPPRERDAPCSPGVGHTPGIAPGSGTPGCGVPTPGTSGHFLLQVGKTNQKNSATTKPSFFLPPNAKSVSKPSQVAEKQKFPLPARLYIRPRRGNAAAETARPPDAPRAAPAPSLSRGRATPGARFRVSARPGRASEGVPDLASCFGRRAESPSPPPAFDSAARASTPACSSRTRSSQLRKCS